MSLKQRVRTNIFAALSAIVALSSLSLPTYAAATTSTATNASTNVLKVTPVRSDIQIAAGTSQTVPITVTNVTGSAITVSPIENDFIAKDETGAPALILDANTYAPTHSLKRFMTPLTDITVPANDAKTINVVITVPSSAQAGGYFGAIRLTPALPGASSQLNLSASVASLILLTVPGPTVEKLNLTNFDVEQNGKASTYFATPNNLQFYLRFQNEGNLQEGPFGSIGVKKGNKIVYETNFNSTQPRDVVLPDSARRWDVPLNDIGTFGHYTIEANLTYGLNNQTVNVTESFWVIPTWMLIAALVALVVIIGVIVLIVILNTRKRKHRRLYGRKGGAGHLRY